MAMTTRRLTQSSSTSALTSYTTASISPNANTVLLVAFAAWDNDTQVFPYDITGGPNNTTWYWLDTVVTGGAGLGTISTMVGVVRSSPGSGALTFPVTEAPANGAAWTVIEVTGSGLGGNPVLSRLQSSGAAVTSASPSTGASSRPDNRAFMFITSAGVPHSPGTNWTELADIAIGATSRGLSVQWRSDTFASPSPVTFSTTTDWAGVSATLIGPNDIFKNFMSELPSGQAFGTPTVARISPAQNITAGATASGEAFGTAAVTQPVHLLRDNFTTLDSARWVHWGSASVSGGALHITCSPAYDAVESHNMYSLRESSVYVQTLGWPTGASTEMYLRFYRDANNQVLIGNIGGLLGLRVRTAGTWDDTYLTFDPVADAWWKIRATSSSLYLSTSPDGHAWTDRTGYSAPDWIDVGQVHLQTGYWGTESAPGEAVFDNLSTTPPLLAVGVLTSEAFGGGSVGLTVDLDGEGPGSGEAVGTATLTPGSVTVAPASTGPGDLGAPAVAHPISSLTDEFAGAGIDTARWHLVGV